MDGQSEIANLTIIDLFKVYVMEVDQRAWLENYFLMVEYAYNNTIHTFIGEAFFKVIKGSVKLPLIFKPHGKIFATDEYSKDTKASF